MVGKVGVCICGSDDWLVHDLPFLASLLLSGLEGPLTSFSGRVIL